MIWKSWFEKTTFKSKIPKRNIVFEEIKPKSTQKPHSFWKSALWKVRFENGDLRKPPSRAEFSKGMWFLMRLSLNLFKNHILFGNRLWKVRFENGDLRKWFEETTFMSRILKRNIVFEEIKPKSNQKPHSFWKSALKSQDLKMVIWESDLRKPPSWAEFWKGMWFLRRLILNLLKNHILFGNRLWKVRFENGDLRKWFEKTTFTSRILKRNVVLEEIKPKSTQKPLSFWKSINLLSEKSNLKMVIWENHLHEQNSQKEPGFWGD